MTNHAHQTHDPHMNQPNELKRFVFYFISFSDAEILVDFVLRFFLPVTDAPSFGVFLVNGFLRTCLKIPPLERGLRSSGFQSNNSIYFRILEELMTQF